MNSGEIYDFTDRPTTAPSANVNPNNAEGAADAATTSAAAPQPSLEEEVQQALGAVGRFWGSFRAKAESGLQTARRDMAGVVQQAQREIGKLSAPATTAAAASSSSTTTPTQTEGDAAKTGGDGATATTTAPNLETPAEASTSTSASTASGEPSAAGAWGVFANLQQTLRTLEASVASGQASQQLQQRTLELRSQLESQLHKAQEGLAPALQRAQSELAELQTRAQAELAKVQDAAAPTLQRIQSEAGPLLSNASTFLADAVKVVPPAESSDAHGVAWDGSDLWDTPAASALDTPSGKGKERAGSRSDAMLYRIRTDPGLFTGPLNAEEQKEWAAYEDTLKQKGAVAGDAELDALEKQLVEKMTSEAFWQRYHFRVHQVEVDEEKRKALLAAQSASQQDDELFSWDDDDDAPSASKPSVSPAPTIKEKSSNLTTTNDKEKEAAGNESEASYDVVSGAASPAKVPETLKEKEGKKKEEDGDDSDWE